MVIKQYEVDLMAGDLKSQFSHSFSFFSLVLSLLSPVFSQKVVGLGYFAAQC